jgi:hypothetical protein
VHKGRGFNEIRVRRPLFVRVIRRRQANALMMPAGQAAGYAVDLLPVLEAAVANATALTVRVLTS